MASRANDAARRRVDREKIPFPDVRLPQEFIESHRLLLTTLVSAIWRYARNHRQLVDSDVIAALQSQAETYRTLSSGLYYEKPPDYVYRRELYNVLKEAVEEFKKVETQRLGLVTTRDSEIRDTLIFLTQLAATNANDRPKGRAFLDFVRANLASEEPAEAASNIVLLS
jgi:hypothetical protein